ncbi:uncharacterized protein LOC100884103 isoform X2 [Megachile rotundata]|uniref:uncharacterized protein LOC100884103 isoform X2 n=1 Tax=Megachile rotundata TaxID=143995 RepID=UPI000614E438|nr:PREDICTED: SH3 domain-containing kinase-binding protein 1-like isoform X2 [Megachile rotundata]
MEAIVEYNYEAQEPDELTLKKGDIITEIEVLAGGWWEGTLRDKRGMFPDNFVKVLKPVPSGTVGSTGSGGSEGVNNNKSEDVTLRNDGSRRRFCKVLFDYEPCNKDELTLVPQDTIEFLGEVEDGWWRGRLKGKVGVFPSNFVSPPVYEEPDKHKQQNKKELYKVLFPYKAANDDELTLNEGDIITLLSKDASDEGWWIGEINGRIGLFPDNFVEIVNVAPDQTDHEQRQETSVKSAARHSYPAKKSEKVHTRKSLDVQLHTEVNKKAISTSASSSTSSTSPGIGESDVGTNNGNENTNISLGEELDVVERIEGAPLSHLTASRAKAPRRRPPSSQRLRRYTAGPTITTTTTTTPEDTLANGNGDTILKQIREKEPEGLAAKARRKVPWVKELKLNHIERRKIGLVDHISDISELKKKFNNTRVSPTTNVAKPIKKDSSQKSNTSSQPEQTSPTSGTPAYVPYEVFNQLLERVASLEEKQAMLQESLTEILEQFVVTISSLNNVTN